MSAASTTTPAPRPWGLLLAGGQSTRMGQDKGALVHDGVSWTGRVAIALAAVCDVVIVAGHGRGAPAHLRRVDDLERLAGPVGGLAAGLEAARIGGAVGVVVAPVDMPLLTPEPLSSLWTRALEHDAVAVFAAAAVPQPLPAALSSRAATEVLRRIASGARSLRAALDLPAANVLDLAPWRHALQTANSPEELAFLAPSRREPSE